MEVHVIFLSFRVQILQIDNTSEGEGSLQAIFLFSVASRFKNEEGSCYLLVVPCTNPSDRQHKRGRRFITMFLFSVASVTL